jgi:hypothetical protein
MELLIFITAAMSLVLVAFAYEHIKFLRRYQHLVEENRRLTRDTDKELQRILQHAMGESQLILEQARIRAQETLAEVKIFSTETQQKFSDSAKSLLHEEQSSYEEAIKKTKEEVTLVLMNTSEAIKSRSEEHLVDFSNKMEEDLKQVRMQSKMNLEEYQKTMYNKIDESIYEVIQEVLQKVLGKSLNVVEHEKLVIDALQEAKHEHSIS